MDTQVIQKTVAALSQRRPVFWSEADFQHELAVQLAALDPSLQIRLEWPLPGQGIRAIDILLSKGQQRTAVELKYLTQKYSGLFANEQFELKAQGAQDVRRYDVIKDIQRMEEFCDRFPSARAFVLVLSNDPVYWAGPTAGTNCEAFSLKQGRVLGGQLTWAEKTGAGTMKSREKPLTLANRYQVNWVQYSLLSGKYGEFRSTMFDVSQNSYVD